MQAIYLLDQSVNIHSAPDAWRTKCKPVVNATGDVTEWIVPKGTVIEGDEALLRVKTGQCAPFDEECAQASGQSASQLGATQRQYLAASVGIKGKKDLELFMAGIIEGYDKGTTDDHTVYIHGPNWDAWQAVKADNKKNESPI